MKSIKGTVIYIKKNLSDKAKIVKGDMPLSEFYSKIIENYLDSKEFKYLLKKKFDLN